jgi:hypothetical protein
VAQLLPKIKPGRDSRDKFYPLREDFSHFGVSFAAKHGGEID